MNQFLLDYSQPQIPSFFKHQRKMLLVAVCILFSIFSFGQKKTNILSSVQKHLKKIDDHLYASATEVSNHEYRIFLDFLKRNQAIENLTIAQIDSAQWRREYAYNEPFVSYYHSHPAFQNYPVVNISYEGAVLYCDWLTEQYNTNPRRKFHKVLFRLPTAQEWKQAAQGGNDSAIYPWKGDQLKNKKGMYHCNFIRVPTDSMGVAGYIHDNADITAPVKSYEPNAFGLYNMSGNVAEMLSEKGKTRGGSWQDVAEAMKIDSQGRYAEYSTPCPAVGFRFFMEVIEK